jgi:serine/threonine protein kinase
MNTFAGYRLTEPLYESSRTLIYQGKRLSDQRSVVIKLLKAEYPALRDLVQFQNHYAVSKNLNLPGVVQPYGLEDHHNGFALVMEFGGIPLLDYFGRLDRTDASQRSPDSPRPSRNLPATSLYAHNPSPQAASADNPDAVLIIQANAPQLAIDLGEFLAIAIQIVQILAALARHRVIHKDIKPQHILINPDTAEVKIIDFSIASLLPKEKQEIQNPDVLEGTLSYMSPEQTGRMNRGIDTVPTSIL